MIKEIILFIRIFVPMGNGRLLLIPNVIAINYNNTGVLYCNSVTIQYCGIYTDIASFNQEYQGQLSIRSKDEKRTAKKINIIYVYYYYKKKI